MPDSRVEELLQGILEDGEYTGTPSSRIEAQLIDILGGDVDLSGVPSSRIEALIMQIKENQGSGGEGGITPTGTARSSADLSANNLTVTAPAGLYAENASKTLSDANLVAGNIKKDVTIFGTTGTYEGSGGLPETLLGSGTFNVASASSEFIFPVAYSGTPTQLLVTKDTEDAGVGETLAWFSLTSDLLTVSTTFPLKVRLYKIKNANDGIYYMTNFTTDIGVVHLSKANGTYDASGNYITIWQYGNNNKIQPGDYHWYIYGSSS